MLAIVLRPQHEHDHKAKYEEEDGHVEGCAVTTIMCRAAQCTPRCQFFHISSHLTHLSSHYGNNAVEEHSVGEGTTQQIRVKVATIVLGDKPCLENAEEQGSGNAASDAAEHEIRKVCHMLRGTRYTIQNAVQSSESTATHVVCQGADESSKYC